MRTTDLLNQVPGLTRDRLIYWVKRGYVQFKLIKVGNRNVKDYDERLIPQLRQMVEMVQKDISAKSAYLQIAKGMQGFARRGCFAQHYITRDAAKTLLLPAIVHENEFLAKVLREKFFCANSSRGEDLATILHSPWITKSSEEGDLRKILQNVNVRFTGQILHIIVQCCVAFLAKIDVEAFASLTPSSTLIAGALSLAMLKEEGRNLDVVVLVTDKGEPRMEGALKPGTKVCQVVDVIRTAQPIITGTRILEQSKCEPAGVVGVLGLMNAEEETMLKEKGLSVHAIFGNEDELFESVHRL